MPAIVDLSARNTPLQQVDALAAALGLQPGQLFIKRDDLTGLPVGGNKARKLEYLVADALAAEADILVTAGAAQSNHVRATATAARQVGLDCHAVMSTAHGHTEAEGNLLLDDLLGVTLTWCGPTERNQTLAAVTEQLIAAGRRPYTIPLGGTNGLGACGYVHAADEIAAEVPDALVVCTLGTGGTQAGLVVGLGDYDRVLAIDVAAVPGVAETVPQIVGECSALMARDQPRGNWSADLTGSRIPYGTPLPEVEAAIRLVAQHTGLLLDPVYTGRSFARFAELAREGQFVEQRVVFVHTGGLPALFAKRYQDWFQVPPTWP